MINEQLIGVFAARSHFLFGQATHQRFGLSEKICQKNFVMQIVAKRILRFDRRDEIARNLSRSLMDQLVKGVLTVGTGLKRSRGESSEAILRRFFTSPQMIGPVV